MSNGIYITHSNNVIIMQVHMINFRPKLAVVSAKLSMDAGWCC